MPVVLLAPKASMAIQVVLARQALRVHEVSPVHLSQVPVVVRVPPV